MREFTAVVTQRVEVTIKANNIEEANSIFDDLIANVTIDYYGNQEIEIVSDNTELLETDWEIED